ncbi:MAG: hypothetical protein IJ043_03135 [Clostridia bacterium]|nr:hypothetical protein [Clostridia bacterium]
MKCRANRPKAESRNTILLFILYAVAYAMLDSGYSREETVKLMNNAESCATSVLEDGLKFRHIKQALKEEYDFEICLKE